MPLAKTGSAARYAMATLCSLAILSAAANGAGIYKHVLIISVDGLRQADVSDPALATYLPTLKSLQTTGVTYTNAATSKPSDSFPGEMSYLTGCHPGTHGIFYDDSYSRTLYAPGTTAAKINNHSATAGTKAEFTEITDKDQTLLSGGGNFDKTSIDNAKLPVDAQGNPVQPRDYLKVNTIFGVVHAAGLTTAFSDKHASAYDIANGPGTTQNVDDNYSPEINSNTAILDGKLVDSSSAPAGTKLVETTTQVPLVMAYDELKLNALLNEIHGQNSRGTSAAAFPALVAMNFQAVSCSEKSPKGGIDVVDGTEHPNQPFTDALTHTDAGIAQIIQALKTTNDPANGQPLFNDTLVILTAKHGQNPRRHTPGGPPFPGNIGPVITKFLSADPATKDIKIAQATEDDAGLYWLDPRNPNRAADAATIATTLLAHKADLHIKEVLTGAGLVAAKLGDPATNDRTPDVIVELDPGFILTSAKKKREEHGGFSDDDFHIALILATGNPALKPGMINAPVETTQIAVTTLEALGLNPKDLQGVAAEGTGSLPTVP